MLKDRIIATIHFFDLQDIPLTLFEVHKYLLADMDVIKIRVNAAWEVTPGSTDEAAAGATLAEVQACLDSAGPDEIKSYRGYYYLPSRDEAFVTRRLHNYMYGIYRERVIARHTRLLRYVPFLRSIGLVGSQALGQHKADSDIDVLVIVQPGYIWLARFFVTAYFQLAGVRRYGSHVANRFCLNHYLAGPKALGQDRNMYTASEYAKARAIYHAGVLNEFKQRNAEWIRLFFPNIVIFGDKKTAPPALKTFLETLFRNKFGRWLEQQAGRYQQRRIKRDEFVVVEEDELSFHPDNRKAQLFAAFFEHQQ